MEEYYTLILNLANSHQHMVNDLLLTTFFKVGLLPYLCVTTVGMKRNTFIQHLEATVTCEENPIDVDNN
jgi:hypothetical protein